MRDGTSPPADPGGSAGRELRHVVAGSLISVAGLIGRPVRDDQGAEVGRVTDVLVRGEGGEYPRVCGIAARLGLRRIRIDADHLASIGQQGVELSSTVVDLRRWEPEGEEMLVVRHVLDHQLVDVDGVRVVRAADLYLAELDGGYALVGADVSVSTLLRRALPGAVRRRASPKLVLDWAQVQPFAHPGGAVRLREPHAGLHSLHPAQLAELLADLGCRQQHELLAALEPGHAARTLGHLDASHLRLLLHGARPEHAVRLVSELHRAGWHQNRKRTRRWPWHRAREQEHRG